MKKIFVTLGIVLFSAVGVSAWADAPVISANGFICGKQGVTVTCKGPLPNGKDTITGTGHNVVYLTVNTTTAGSPARYTYFSDTGCLVGYTFNAAGNPVQAVASHRSGAKQTFDFGEGKYEPLLNFCAEDQPAPKAGSNTAATAPATPSAEKKQP